MSGLVDRRLALFWLLASEHGRRALTSRGPAKLEHEWIAIRGTAATRVLGAFSNSLVLQLKRVSCQQWRG